MKKIKNYALGLIGITFLAVAFYACSNEDANSPQKEASVQFNTKSTTVFEGGLIAKIENGNAMPLYDETELKDELVSQGLFGEVESIELVYGYNPDEGREEAFITYLGTDAVTSAPAAVIIDLTIDGGDLIIPNPEITPVAFAKHSCNGFNCRSCAFTRQGFFRRITGCTECQTVIDESAGAGCVHSINGGGTAVEVAKVSYNLVKP